MKTIKVGGVPEHFNYPWHHGIATGIFQKYGLNIDWHDIKGGSGAMCKMLDDDTLDVALVLTEGIVKHIHNGSPARIVQQYVKSPLIWGVHSAMHSELNAANLENARFARSRVGSGSHLMSYVHAEQKGYVINENNFVTVGNIDGAMEAFNKNEADVLLWEKFMTQPYVDNEQAQRIGLCVSPWPCFTLVASGSLLAKEDGLLRQLSDAIIESCIEVTKSPDTINLIAKRYDLEISQVNRWYDTVEWQTSPWVSKKMLANVSKTLDRVNILNATPMDPERMCFSEAKIY